MEKIFSPWRSQYIQSFKDENLCNDNTCFLCEASKAEQNLKELLVVARREKCFVILNRFPYNSGHLMIVPYRHIADIEDLTPEELNDMLHVVQESVSILKEAYKPHGFNIGINIGREAGAGVPGHIHIHIVPRWNGDTSFIPVLADVKVVSDSIRDSCELLTTLFEKSEK